MSTPWGCFMMGEMTIKRAEPDDEVSMAQMLDVVAREEKYIGLLVGPTPDEVRAYWEQPTSQNNIVLIAFDDDDQAIGWVNIDPGNLEIFRHVAGLGMGILPAHRGKGLGTRLMNVAMDAAWDLGIERIELRVYASNIRAIKLYEKVGFVLEGVERQARFLHGNWDDITNMAILNPDHMDK